MRNILYIGNNLSYKQSNLTYNQVLGNYLETEGFKVNYASSKKNKVLRLLDMVFSCFRYYKKTDLVLIDTYSTTNFYYALVVGLFCQVLRLPYIPILHGGNLKKRLNKNPYLSKLLFSNAKVLVSPSQYLQELFIKKGFNNIVYIPNAIKLENYKYYPPKVNKVKMLWVRSFSTIYNPYLAITVLRKLLDAGFEAELCMVGPDNDGSLVKVKNLAKELKVKVEFTGKLTKQQWISLSKDYNIFINTTNFDNMPVSVIEAMALGLPIVSTNVGGLPYLISNEKDGLLVKPNDEIEFTNAIKRLVNDLNFAQYLAKNAREKAKQFDWFFVKDKWISLLNN